MIFCCYSDDIVGVHSDKTYKYKIGICTPPSPREHPDCGIIQYEYRNNGTILRTYCIGQVTQSQVAESKWAFALYSGFHLVGLLLIGLPGCWHLVTTL